MKLHFQKLPNCTVALSKFQKFSWGGAHRAPSPNPSPRFHSALRASIPRFARTRRFAPRCALRAISALRASVRVSRKLGASRLHANVVRTSNICTAREKILPTPLYGLLKTKYIWWLNYLLWESHSLNIQYVQHFHRSITPIVMPDKNWKHATKRFSFSITFSYFSYFILSIAWYIRQTKIHSELRILSNLYKATSKLAPWGITVLISERVFEAARFEIRWRPPCLFEFSTFTEIQHLRKNLTGDVYSLQEIHSE